MYRLRRAGAGANAISEWTRAQSTAAVSVEAAAGTWTLRCLRRLRRAEEEPDDEENDAGAPVGLAVVAADEESVSSLLLLGRPEPCLRLAQAWRGRVDER